jgi:hypothetical protein
VFRSTPQANLLHAGVYLTPPIVLVCAIGASRIRGAARQTLLIPALVLCLPILLGPTDSPRNLLTGVCLLLALAGDALDRWIDRAHSLGWAAAAVLLVGAGVYGLGTVVETMSRSALPASSAAEPIRVDGAGWRAVGDQFEDGTLIFALDYSIASQMRYYGGRPVHTAWGQYRMWGIPALCGADAGQERVQIAALGYLDPDHVSALLRQTFAQVQGPVRLEMGEDKVLYTWAVRGCGIEQERFLERFDFMSLLEAGAGR